MSPAGTVADLLASHESRVRSPLVGPANPIDARGRSVPIRRIGEAHHRRGASIRSVGRSPARLDGGGVFSLMPQEVTEQRTGLAQVSGALIWLGGGHRRELGERHERSTHAVAGAVVLSGAALAWLVATLAISESARWPLPAVLPLTLVFGLLVGAVARGTIPGPARSRPGVVGRVAVAAAVGVVVGDLAALAILSSSIDHRLDERASRNAESAPTVAQASASLQQSRAARSELDNAVAQAHDRQDK